MELNQFSSRIGATLFDHARFAGGMFNLFRKTIRELFVPPFPFRLVIQQVYAIGVQSFPLAVVTALATGSVMALQFGFGLTKFGGTLYVPKLTALSILREMGPVFTSLLVAGRIGSGMASEIASMKVTQQIDAIRALGTSPIQQIVIPRVLASLIALPALTLMADFTALAGAMLVAKSEFGIGYTFFYTKAVETVILTDLFTGIAKTAVFAIYISLCACFHGLNTEGGTRGVGSTTTEVVVSSSIFIMLADFFLTKFFFLAFYPKQ